MAAPRNPYYASISESRSVPHHQAALMRAVDRLAAMAPSLGSAIPRSDVPT